MRSDWDDSRDEVEDDEITLTEIKGGVRQKKTGDFKGHVKKVDKKVKNRQYYKRSSPGSRYSED